MWRLLLLLGVVLAAWVAVTTEAYRLLDVTRFQTVIEKLGKDALGCQRMQVESAYTTVHETMYYFVLFSLNIFFFNAIGRFSNPPRTYFVSHKNCVYVIVSIRGGGGVQLFVP